MNFIFNIIKYAAIIVGSFYAIKYLFWPIYVLIYNFFSDIRFKTIKKINDRPHKEKTKTKKLYEDHFNNEMNTVYIGRV